MEKNIGPSIAPHGEAGAVVPTASPGGWAWPVAAVPVLGGGRPPFHADRIGRGRSEIVSLCSSWLPASILWDRWSKHNTSDSPKESHLSAGAHSQLLRALPMGMASLMVAWPHVLCYVVWCVTVYAALPCCVVVYPPVALLLLASAWGFVHGGGVLEACPTKPAGGGAFLALHGCALWGAYFEGLAFKPSEKSLAKSGALPAL